MTVERGVRLMAGVMVLLSLALAHFFSLYWLWLTVFVGLNLLQSAFTNWCPAMSILSRHGDERCQLRPGASEADMNDSRFQCIPGAPARRSRAPYGFPLRKCSLRCLASRRYRRRHRAQAPDTSRCLWRRLPAPSGKVYAVDAQEEMLVMATAETG